MKICPRCGVRPSMRNEKKTSNPYCWECSAAYSKERTDRCAKVVQKAKDRPCMDCGNKFPYYVMDLDHRGDKFRAVSQMRSYSSEKVSLEIAKCDVVCSNCHRVRTHQRALLA